jgi:hypothetical protein
MNWLFVRPVLRGPKFAAPHCPCLRLQFRDAPFQLLALAPLVFHDEFLQLLQMRKKLWPGVHEDLPT